MEVVNGPNPIADILSARAVEAEKAAVPQGLGRDEFLQLLVAQLENQDPLEPAKDSEFVAQLATFSSLEQLFSVNENLEGLGAGQASLVNAQALDLIGKSALVEAGNELEIAQGRPERLVYAIPRQAQYATLTVVDPTGAPVRNFNLETTPNGRVDFEWDGTDDNGDPLPDGIYRIQISAVDLEGDPMSLALFKSLPIDGVNFTNGGISLISGDEQIPFDRIMEIHAGS